MISGSGGHRFEWIEHDNVDHWYAARPGDMLVCSGSFTVTWPPDGCRSFISGTFVPRVQFGNVSAFQPFLVLSMKRRYVEFGDRWLKGTQSIIFVNDRMWWKGTFASGSL